MLDHPKVVKEWKVSPEMHRGGRAPNAHDSTADSPSILSPGGLLYN